MYRRKETKKKKFKKMVKWFEREQEQHGTEVAIHNLLWSLAAEQMHKVGVRRVTTKGGF